ncbi:MAG: hypothetical protein V7641_2266 [Blastocatellia bacterium]
MKPKPIALALMFSSLIVKASREELIGPDDDHLEQISIG